MESVTCGDPGSCSVTSPLCVGTLRCREACSGAAAVPSGPPFSWFAVVAGHHVGFWAAAVAASATAGRQYSQPRRKRPRPERGGPRRRRCRPRRAAFRRAGPSGAERGRFSGGRGRAEPSGDRVAGGRIRAEASGAESGPSGAEFRGAGPSGAESQTDVTEQRADGAESQAEGPERGRARAWGARVPGRAGREADAFLARARLRRTRGPDGARGGAAARGGARGGAAA